MLQPSRKHSGGDGSFSPLTGKTISEEKIKTRDLQLLTDEGDCIEATLYEPTVSNGIAVQMNSALAIPREYYRHIASYLSRRGFTVLTYDYRGLFKSCQDIRENSASILVWGRYDQAAATSWLRDQYPDHKLALISHSLGGQIIGLSPLAGEFHAILMVTTSQGYWRRWPKLRQRLHRLLVWKCLARPLTALCGYFPGKYLGMFDFPPIVAGEMSRFGLNPHWLSDQQGQAYRPYNDEVRASLRHVVLCDDRIVPPGAQMDLNDFYPNADGYDDLVEPADYGMEQIGHFGFFRRTMAESAWEDAATWLRDNV